MSSGDADGPGVSSLARWLGAGVVLAVMLVRAMTTSPRVPWWDLDPAAGFMPETTLTPAMGLVLDGLVWLGAAAVAWAESRSGRRVAWAVGALVLAGAVGAGLHGLVLPPIGSPVLAGAAIDGLSASGELIGGEPRSLWIGSAWAAAFAGAWALVHACRDRSVRRWSCATLLGSAAVFVADGLYQVLVEHEYMRLQYRQDPEAMLRSQGIEPGGARARDFERRLLQPDAVGWFGLANVYASFAAAWLAAWAALAMHACRRAAAGALSGGFAGLAAMALLAAGAALWASRSKGGAAAAAVGVAVVVAVTLAPRASRLPRAAFGAAAMGALVAANLAVVVRGLIGERVAELSLLFRWHYAQAAVDIITEHAPAGVGPASFKIAYGVHKVPISPEAVESPHHALLDWISMLGVFGLALAAAWLVWVWRAGRSLARGAEEPAGDADTEGGVRGALTRGLAVIAAVAAFGLWTEFQQTTPATAAVRAVGVLGWLAGVAAVAAVWRTAGGERACRVAMAAAALTLAVHSQIEVTGFLAGSVGLMLAFIAVAASGDEPAADSRSGLSSGLRSRLPARVAALLCAAVGIGVLVSSAQTWRWQGLLRDAAIAASEGASAADAGEASRSMERASDLLLRADGVLPGAPVPIESASRLRLAMSVIAAGGGRDRAAPLVDEAIEMAERSVARRPGWGARWAALAGVLEARSALARATSGADQGSVWAAAGEAWGRASARDPHALLPARRAAELLSRAGEADAAASWAERALEIDERLRLDPLRRLTEAERRVIEAIAARGGGGPGGAAGAPAR